MINYIIIIILFFLNNKLFFFLLYKHYTLYLPLFNIKENIHFINFEWIDMRNYFNIYKIHNNLIDFNVNNNFIYNEIIKN